MNIMCNMDVKVLIISNVMKNINLTDALLSAPCGSILALIALTL